MTWRERALLVLTIVGFVVPNTMISIFLTGHDFDLGAYFGDWVQTLPSIQLIVDLLIAFLAFALWAAWEGKRLGMRFWWVPIPATFLVGVCFAVPLFLLLRERTLGERPTPRKDSGANRSHPEATQGGDGSRQGREETATG